jgi:quercetin dioxygenase-like cupin family protein
MLVGVREWSATRKPHNPVMAYSTLPASQALELRSLITASEHAVASRLLAKGSGGSMTLFAFGAEQGLAEHTSPFEAFVIVLEGVFAVTIGSTPIEARAGQIVRLPASVAHAVEAREASRMLLVMIRDAAGTA